MAKRVLNQAVNPVRLDAVELEKVHNAVYLGVVNSMSIEGRLPENLRVARGMGIASVISTRGATRTSKAMRAALLGNIKKRRVH